MLGVSGRPAYQELADLIRAQVARGELTVGQSIPSTPKLVTHYEVSSTVVRWAVAQLKAEGILIGAAGKGVYVRATPETLATDKAEVETVAQQVDELREELNGLVHRVGDASEGDTLSALRTDVDDLKQQVGHLHAQITDLYGRIGQHYTGRETQAPDRKAK